MRRRQGKATLPGVALRDSRLDGGRLTLTFADPATYDQVGEDDRINVLDLPPVPGRNVRCQIVKPDGTIVDFEGVHTFSPEQVEWFQAGSALNVVRQKVADGKA